MNHDDYKPDLSTLIDPELEARIVAWVSGEASPFEAAELTRLTNEKPELAIFKRRIEAIHGLAAEAIRPDAEPLRLAPERRAKLLQALGATENTTTPTASSNTVVLPTAVIKKKQRNDRRWIYGLAASLTVGFFTLFSVKNYQSQFEAPKIAEFRFSEDEKHREKVLQHALSEAKVNSMQARQETVRMELPVSENLESLAPADGEKRRETDSAYAAANAATKKQEHEERSKELRARAVAVPQIVDRVAQQKSNQASAQTRVYGAIRYDADTAKADNKSKPQPLPASPPAPASKRIVFDLQNPPSLAGTRVGTDLKDVASKPEVRTLGGIIRNERLNYSETTATGGGKANTWSYSASKPSASFDGFNRQNAPAIAGMASRNSSIAARFEGNGSTVVTGDAEKIVLSPFMVEGKKDAGDLAKSNLTAERYNQDVKEISAITFALPLEQTKTPVPAQVFSEISAAKEPVSTFSLHVSDVSFRLAQAALAKGDEPDEETIRPEEFYNAFSYGGPTPALAEKVSCRIEQAAHPFVQQRNLVRIAVKVAAAGRDAAQPLHLTVLLDTSGSMEREDRAATIQSAMKALTSLLGPNDRLTLIGFSRQPRLLAESLSGDQAAQVLDLIKNTPSEGGTNLEEALKLGSELAHRQFAANAQNRIVLLTDGAANLGNANPAQLAASIEALRQQGIAFDACGVGLEGLDDGMLENLTRKGDGRYYVLNSPEAADAGFAKQLAGAFRPAAENVKLQVRFNPTRVGHYRLIGFEKHRLNEEDFRNDKVDAAELAAEEAAVAVYQVEALPQGEGELGEVYVRFRDTASGNMVERNWTLNYDAQAPAFDRANPSMQLAGTAALLAEKLQGGEAAAAINLGDLAPVVTKLRSHYANEPRVQELVTMFEQARKLAGE